MNLPANGVEVTPETFEQEREAGPLLHCDLYDTGIVHKIAQAFLPGLASACVDNTTGGLFKSPASVAVEIRKEMVEYLTQRSEAFVAETVILEGGPEAQVSLHPYDVIADFIDEFASSKRNIFSRVSGWLLSERREDRIDDFVQEMELNGFWFMERREAIAQNLLKNVDFKNSFHCDMKFTCAEDLAEHSQGCNFRTMTCTNEGCNARFCASHLVDHESICPFKILPCEQKCPDRIMRREMDKHCITICPMKLVNCPFYPVGCQSSIPLATIEQHRLENLHTHVLYILQVIHKDVPLQNLKERVDQVKEADSPGRLSEARDVRSLTFAIKDLEAEIGPIKIFEEHPESPNKNEECTELVTNKAESVDPSTSEEHKSSPSKNEECVLLVTNKEESVDLSTREEECKESNNEERNELVTGKEEIINSSTREEGSKELPEEKEERAKLPSEEEKYEESPTKNDVHSELPIREENSKDPSTREGGSKESPEEKEECTKLPSEGEKYEESPTKNDVHSELPIREENLKDPSTREEGSKESPEEKEECTKLPSEGEKYEESPTKNDVHSELPIREENSKDPSTKSVESSESAIEKENWAKSPEEMEEYRESPPKKEVRAEGSSNSLAQGTNEVRT